MDTHPSSDTVVGVFASRGDAERAAEMLRSSGVPARHVNLLLPEATPAKLETIPSSDTESPGTGTAIGAVVGGAAGASGGIGLMSLLVPGVGVVGAAGLAAGALLGLVGATAGAMAGAALEDQLGQGIPRDELFVYEDALRHGHSVVVVLAANDDEAATARAALERAGAESIDAARERWWLGLRDGEHAEYEGEDFATDEPSYRLGFESALAAARTAPLGTDLGAYGRRPCPEGYRDQPFQRGWARGMAHFERWRARRHSEPPAAPAEAAHR